MASCSFIARVAGTEAAANAAALQSYLTGEGRNAGSVVLDITNAKASAVLDHVTHLYNAAAHVDIATRLNVLLRAQEAQEGGLQPLRREHLRTDLGFELDEHVAMGGTFDRLHVGHKVLLTYSVLHAGSRLRIGVTGEALLAKKRHAEMLQRFDHRRGNVESFVRALRSDLQYDVIELTEPTGGTTTIADVTGMVVSPETLPTIDAINEARKGNKLNPVKPILINYIGPDGSDRVSSTALRYAEKTGTPTSANPPSSATPAS